MVSVDVRGFVRRRGGLLVVAAAAAVVTGLAVAPLLTPRLLAGHRPEYHPLRALLVADLWRSGTLVPRWVPELAGGLGYPLFIYYGWLSYALAAGVHLLGLGPTAATNAVTLLAVLAQALGAWKLGRELGGRAGGWAAWALFAFAPYQLVNVYVRGNYPEVVASAFAPWALWAMVRAARGGGRDVPLAAALLAAIVLSHNISGMTLGVTLAAAGLLVAVTLPAGLRRQAVLRIAGSCAAALSLCTFFWLPILVGRADVGLANDFNAYLDFRQHFLEPRQLVATGWGYGFSVAGPGDTMPLQLGLPQVAVLLGLVPLALLRARRATPARRLRLAGFALAGLLLAFMTTAWSEPLWPWLKPLAMLQFPWRLHLPNTLMVATAGALAVRALATPARPSPRRQTMNLLGAAAVSVGVAATALGVCHPLTSYACDEACLRGLLRLGYYTTCIQDEFRPVAAQDLHELGQVMLRQRVTLDGQPMPEVALPGPRQRGAFSLPLHAERPGTLALPIFWFPGWRVTLDGQAAPARPCPGTGVLCTDVPAGSHVLAAAWRPTLVHRAGALVSVATAAGLLLLRLHRRRRLAVQRLP